MPEVRRAVAGQLTELDTSVQQQALKVLQVFKLRYLNTHLEHMMRLADNKTLREELVMFPLGRGADGGVADEHRPGGARGGWWGG